MMPTPPGTPESQLPVVTMVITDNLDPADPSSASIPVQWFLGKPHPYDTNVIVVGMFPVDLGVEIYSVSKDKVTCVRDFIPTDRVRLIQEKMSADVFVDELDDSVSDYNDDGGDPEPEPEPSPDPEPAAN